jgi:hypothetical protein
LRGSRRLRPDLCPLRSLLERVETPNRGDSNAHTMTEYEDLFFQLTLQRERYLRHALRLTWIAGALFVFLVACESYARMTLLRCAVGSGVHAIAGHLGI